MGISLGLVGVGRFARSFADLFKAHPMVDRFAVCDREPERVRQCLDDPWFGDKLAPRDAFTSFDDICASDLDALAIFTQPWLHAGQCAKVLEAGKHVYSAVPVIMLPDGHEILDWCDTLINTVRKAGRHYMLGETTVFQPETMFCRRKAAAGEFGDFVYAEGEYIHDVDEPCSRLRDIFEHRFASQAGQEWIAIEREYQERGCKTGPMHYPTHSMSGPLAVMKTRARKVTCCGYRNRNNDPFFAGDAFSNQVALFKLANGASLRICELRETGGPIHVAETFRITGTRGMYAERCWSDNGRISPDERVPHGKVTLTPDEMRDPLPPEVAAAFQDAAAATGRTHGGHGGSHPYLVHEFVDAVVNDRAPAVSIWDAARYMAMGVTAHESALRDGEWLDVPDWEGPSGG